MTEPWTHDKHKRIARLTKRLDQIDTYLNTLDDLNNNHERIPKSDAPVLNYELACLRKIAEELGDIPKSDATLGDDDQLNVYIHGINTDQL